MAFDERLAQRVREVLSGAPMVTERRMFGGLAFMVRGHMTVGISGTSLMARVGRDKHTAASRREHVRPMDVTGKPVNGYVFVAAPALATDKGLREWLKLCLAFVRTLPDRKK